MKKLAILTASLVTGILFTASAQAQIISVQYGSTSLNTSATGSTPATTSGISAGDLAATYWNPDTTAATYFGTETTGISGGLTDSTGAATTITETKFDDGTYKAGGAVTGFSNPGDNDLYNSGVYGPSPVSINLAGLSSSAVYNLYVYVSDPNGASGTTINGVVGSESFYLKTESNSAIASYDLGTATTAGAALPGNYFEFTGLTGSTTLTATLLSGGTELAGFQLQQVVATPEPSSTLLMGFGLVGLIFMLRRRRASSLSTL